MIDPRIREIFRIACAPGRVHDRTLLRRHPPGCWPAHTPRLLDKNYQGLQHDASHDGADMSAVRDLVARWERTAGTGQPVPTRPSPLREVADLLARGLEDRAVESEVAVTLARTISRWLGEHPQEWEPDEFNPYHRAALAVIETLVGPYRYPYLPSPP